MRGRILPRLARLVRRRPQAFGRPGPAASPDWIAAVMPEPPAHDVRLETLMRVL